MTSTNKLMSGKLWLYGSNANFEHTYHWCDQHTFLDPAIAGTLNFTNGSSLALSYNAAVPALSKIVSFGFGDWHPALCEE
jgi:hypothetical protein